MFHINGIMQYGTFCVWHLLLSITFQRLVCDWNWLRGNFLFIVIIQVSSLNIKFFGLYKSNKNLEGLPSTSLWSIAHAQDVCRSDCWLWFHSHTHYIFETQVWPLGHYDPRIPSFRSLRRPAIRKGPEIARSNFKWISEVSDIDVWILIWYKGLG